MVNKFGNEQSSCDGTASSPGNTIQKSTVSEGLSGCITLCNKDTTCKSLQFNNANNECKTFKVDTCVLKKETGVYVY